MTPSHNCPSASHFQVSSRKLKLVILDNYGNRLFTLHLGLPMAPLSFSFTQALPFSCSHLPPSFLQISFLSDIFCSDTLSLKSHPIYLPIFHEQTYGLLLLETACYRKQPQQSQVAHSDCVRRFARHNFPIMESEDVGISSLFHNYCSKYKIKVSDITFRKPQESVLHFPGTWGKISQKRDGGPDSLVTSMNITDCFQKTRRKR